MYLYFDSTGTLKEIVNDSKARQGSDNVNKLYFYFEDASAYSAIALTIKYPNGTTSTPYVITSNIATVTFPESLNKLSYFVEGKNYSMYYYTLSSTDLAQSGMCSATVVAYTGGSANAYGLFTFKVEQSVLAENITLTQTDLTYILEQIANVAGDISVFVSPSEPTSIVSTLGRSQDPLLPTTLGENSVELGKNAEASANGSVALGEGVTASGINSIAIGNYSIASGQGATAMASGTASGQESFAFGYSSQATNSYSIAFGTSSSVTSSYAIGIGVSTSVTGSNGMAIGRAAECTNSNGIAIGGVAESNGMGAIAFGYNAKSTNAYDIAIGNRAKASGSYSGAIGEEAEVTGTDSMAYGYKAKVTSQHAIQLGQGTNASDNSLQFRTRKIIDYNASRTGQEYSFAILSGGTTGQVLKKKSNTNYEYEWGDIITNETVYVQPQGGVSTSITSSISSNTNMGTYIISLGYGAQSRGNYGIALGTSSTVASAGAYGLAIGSGATVNGQYGVSLGYNSLANNDYGVAIGYNAKANNGNAGSVAIGKGAETYSNGSIAIGEGANTDINSVSAIAIGSGAGATGTGAIQLGRGYNRQANTLQFQDIVIADGSTKKLAVKISSSIDPSTYVMTLNLLGTKWDNVNSVYNDVTLSTTTIDLPLEEMVISGSYDDNTKSIILTLKSGQSVTIPVSDLVSGLQTQSNILDALSLLPTNQTGLITLTNGVASLDTNSYATVSALSGYQPLNSYLTSISALSNNQTGLIKLTNGVASLDTSFDGGTTGQVLTKDSNSDGDYSWQDPSGAGAYTFKNYISTNTLPVSPAKGDVWISDSASPLVFTIGGGGGGTLQAIDIGDTFAQGSYVYFDNTVSDADMLTFLQGLTYVDGTCDLVTCEDDQSQTKALITAINMDISEDPEDPQYIYALSCYTSTDDSVVWISDGSAMGMTTGWQTLTAEGGLLLDYPDGESQLEVTTLNTVATGWNGVIVFNMSGGSSITLTLNKGDWLTYNGSSWDKVDNQEYATTSYVDNLVGDINSILDAINGEVI